MARLTPRGRGQRWLSSHRGINESPPDSNTDWLPDGIRAAQKRLGVWLIGLPWCGVWACNAALEGGVKPSRPYRWASVAMIEDDAKAGVNGFRDWRPRPSAKGKVWSHVYRGDLVVLFGRGVHVETIRSCKLRHRALGYIVTDGGNTSSGNSGSQANGGGSYKRRRPISSIHGIARVDYPKN